MKTWYYAVCDKCKEYSQVMVDAPERTTLYLGDKNDSIYSWMQKHYGCELKLAWRDDQNEKLYDDYTETKHEKDTP